MCDRLCEELKVRAAGAFRVWEHLDVRDRDTHLTPASLPPSLACALCAYESTHYDATTKADNDHE